MSKNYDVLNELVPKTQELHRAIFDKGYEQGKRDVLDEVLDLIEHYNSDGLGAVFYDYEEGVKFADAVNKLLSIKQEPSILDTMEQEFGKDWGKPQESEDKEQ